MQPVAAPDAPKVIPGRRVQNNLEILEAASERVIQTLTDKRFAQCFPEYSDKFPELMKAVKARVEHFYREGIKLAIEQSMQRYDFVDKTNELDRILADATERRERGEAPRMLFVKGTDARVTVPNATTPLLRAASAELKAKRLALNAMNEATYGEIVRNQVIYDRVERQVREIIDDFHKSVQAFEASDEAGLTSLQERILALMPAGP